MRVFAYLTVAVASLVPVATQAALDEGLVSSRNIEQELRSALPKSLRDILHISVEGNHGRAQFDITQGVVQFDRIFHVSEMTPLDIMFTKATGRIWNVTSHRQSMSVAGDIFWGEWPTHFRFDTGSYDLTAAFDAAARSTTAKLFVEDMNLTSNSVNTKRSSSIKNYKAVVNVAPDEKGLLQGSSEITSETAREMRKIPGFPDEFTLQAKVVHDFSSFAGVDADGLTSIVTALWKKKDSINTTITKLIIAFRDHPSLLDNLDDHGEWDSDELSFRDIKLFADRIGYRFKFSGKPQDYTLGFDLNMDHATAQPGRFPHAVEQAMPDKAAFGFTLRRIDPEAALLAWVRTERLLNKPKRQRTVNGALFSHGMKLDIQNTYARSQFYDVTLSGSINIENLYDRRAPGEIDLTVKARDLDKTVGFLQANADSVPQFGKVSFFVLMAKGFGKQQSDGTMVWNIKIDQSKKVTVNGNPMPRF